jgi:hypothetical protein
MPLHRDYRPTVDALLEVDPDTPTDALVAAVLDANDVEKRRRDALPRYDPVITDENGIEV